MKYKLNFQVQLYACVDILKADSNEPSRQLDMFVSIVEVRPQNSHNAFIRIRYLTCEVTFFTYKCEAWYYNCKIQDLFLYYCWFISVVSGQTIPEKTAVSHTAALNQSTLALHASKVTTVNTIHYIFDNIYNFHITWINIKETLDMIQTFKNLIIFLEERNDSFI